MEPRPLNAYELKQQARRERYEDRAASASQASDSNYQKARDMASLIPFGQPILVGHHSERRDRNYRGKIHTTFGKSFALQDKANHYARKAETVGTGGISSDDPDAVTKLTEKLAGLERSQVRMKAANKIIRSSQTTEGKIMALVALGFSESGAAQVLEKDFAGRVGFPAYALSNNSAVIRSTQQRIKQLVANQQRAPVERKGNGYTYREDTEENRVMFVFHAKPDPEAREQIRLVMHDHGFKWSSTRTAWVRKLNTAAIWSAEQVTQKLKSIV
ncbi:conjugal transfer protein TraC [Pseudomonas sp. BRG-100]|nr:conjugal transfer protein TraC [Pseudomonas sp. BRG-100]